MHLFTDTYIITRWHKYICKAIHSWPCYLWWIYVNIKPDVIRQSIWTIHTTTRKHARSSQHTNKHTRTHNKREERENSMDLQCQSLRICRVDSNTYKNTQVRTTLKIRTTKERKIRQGRNKTGEEQERAWAGGGGRGWEREGMGMEWRKKRKSVSTQNADTRSMLQCETHNAQPRTHLGKTLPSQDSRHTEHYDIDTYDVQVCLISRDTEVYKKNARIWRRHYQAKIQDM